jgi:hypothetical protein
MTAEWAAKDSRDYIVAFALSSTNDCPADFELPSSMAGFDTGLFLPRGYRDPCVLLLKDDTLSIVSHPGTGEPPRQCGLQQISSVEAGHMLLKGWLRFTGSGFDYTIRYNTRGIGPVLRFMRCFRERWLRGAGPHGTSDADAGTGLDIKFGNALALEIDSGESLLLHVFQPPREARRHRWLAGDLLALTSRRLLWITDRERGFCSRYGSIATYVPLEAVRSIVLISGGDMLQVELNDGTAWQIPIAAENRGVVEELAAALETTQRKNKSQNWESAPGFGGLSSRVGSR